jgi:hypothetical protein
MEITAPAQPLRRPRFRRASEPPAFRLTDDDVEIVRQIARHRLIRSTHIAALVGRSLDRTNDRLLRLFHAGYVDRPRAQLDRFPTSGSAHYVYALADRGARLLREHDDVEWHGGWSRKNREAGRPFIEHQIAIVDFRVALQRAVAQRRDIRLIDGDELNAAATLRRHMPARRSPFGLSARLSRRGIVREISVVPDLVFGLELPGGTRRNFVVEIDRGTMPVRRSNPTQTSIESKMRVYLAAHAAKQHERLFGWKNFRVLVVTTDSRRVCTMTDTLRSLRVPRSSGVALFLFATFGELHATTPLAHDWVNGAGYTTNFIGRPVPQTTTSHNISKGLLPITTGSPFLSNSS